MQFNPWNWARERLNAYHVPSELHLQSESLGRELPYEDALDEGFVRPVILLADGAIGLVWRCTLLPHEVLTNEELAERSRAVARVFACLTEPDQVSPAGLRRGARVGNRAPGVPRGPRAGRSADRGPGGGRAPDRSPRDAGVRRGPRPIAVPDDAAGAPPHDSGCAGIDRAAGVVASLKRGFLGVAEAEEEAGRLFAEAVQRLLDIGMQLEDGLEALGLEPLPCRGSEVLQLLRRVWHDEAERLDNPCLRHPYDPSRRLGSQVAKGWVRQNRVGVQVGVDTWEVVSWMEQPQQVSFGLFSLLMGIGLPLRCVLNLRPCPGQGDLALAKTQLSAPLLHSERKVRHLEELRHVEECLVHGESLFWIGAPPAREERGGLPRGARGERPGPGSRPRAVPGDRDGARGRARCRPPGCSC